MLKSIIKKHHAKFVLVLIIFLMMLMTATKAQNQPNPSANAQAVAASGPASIQMPSILGKGSFDIGGDIKRAAKIIEESFKKIRKDGQAMSSNAGVTRLASLLAFTFGTIAIVFPAIRIAFGGGDSAMENFLMALLTVGVFATFLVGGNYIKLVEALSGMTSDLGTSLLGGATNPIEAMGTNLKNTIDGFAKNIPDTLEALSQGIGYTIFVVLLGFVAIIFMLIAFFFILIYLNVGNVLMAIAMALGPIFIAMGVWSVTRTFFDKWLQFLLIAGMYEVISKLILALIGASSLLPTAVDPTAMTSMANIFFALFTMATLAYIASLIPDVVNALMPSAIGGMSSAGSKGVGAAKSTVKFVKSKLPKGD